jgi:hypothetical protein
MGEQVVSLKEVSPTFWEAQINEKGRGWSVLHRTEAVSADGILRSWDLSKISAMLVLLSGVAAFDVGCSSSPIAETEYSKMRRYQSQNATDGGCKYEDLEFVEDICGSLSECGRHIPIVAQRRHYEVPIEITISKEKSDQVQQVVCYVSMKCETSFIGKKIRIDGREAYGKIDCERFKPHLYDPVWMSYFIVGYNEDGDRVCCNDNDGEVYNVQYMTEMQHVKKGRMKIFEIKKCENRDCSSYWGGICPRSAK